MADVELPEIDVTAKAPQAPPPPPPKAPVLPIDSPDAERAVVMVDGSKFEDWETVWVQCRWLHGWDYFRFSTAERRGDNNLSTGRTWLVFPCDFADIKLAGQLVVSGVVLERQVAYDVDNHGVQISGKGNTKWGYMSSVNTQDGSFDNMTFEQIARAILTPYLVAGQKILPIGKLNPLPFEKAHCQKGETCWDFLDSLARVRGIVMGSNEKGDYVFVGDHTAPAVATLKEGFNIKSLQCSINVDELYGLYQVVSQDAGSDSHSGTAASEPKGQAAGSGCIKNLLITPTEQPVSKQQELDDRAKNEAKWHEAARVTVTAVVYGWLWAPGQLWRVGQSVWVDSPMCPLNQKMTIQRATYTQDRNSGTQTTLDLVMPWMVNDVDTNLGPFAFKAPTIATPDILKQYGTIFKFPMF